MRHPTKEEVIQHLFDGYEAGFRMRVINQDKSRSFAGQNIILDYKVVSEGLLNCDKFFQEFDNNNLWPATPESMVDNGVYMYNTIHGCGRPFPLYGIWETMHEFAKTLPAQELKYSTSKR